MNVKDLTGQRFGRLVAQCFSHRDFHGNQMWGCLCDCGGIKTARLAHLNSGATRSCGCLSRDTTSINRTTHGCAKPSGHSPEYTSWRCMRNRCNDPKHIEFHRYGAKGVIVCSRWQFSFQNFLKDMGRKPTPKHSIDRFPNPYGNYELGNCRWATAKEQANNKRAKTRADVS